MARYGLPSEVKFCRKCVQSNQRPASRVEYLHKPEQPATYLHIDEEGVCDACRAVEDTYGTIDWEARETALRELLDAHRGDGSKPDCIVPGSGGKDSVFAAWTLKNVYGMTPLLVHWAPFKRTEWGERNWKRWKDLSPFYRELERDEEVHRLLTKLSIETILHPFWSFIVGQKACAAKVAAETGIPLVFYGETEALYGNPLADTTTSLRDKSYFAWDRVDDIYLGGVHISELRDEYGLSDAQLAPYLPAKPADIERVGVEVRYLGWYLGPWIPQEMYYFAVDKVGFETNHQRTEGTYSKYNSLDESPGIDGLHYYTTYQKFGIGRATYDASQEIRNKHLTREEGVALVKRFDGEVPVKSLEVLSDLGISEGRFFELCAKARPDHLFDSDGNLLKPVWKE